MEAQAGLAMFAAAMDLTEHDGVKLTGLVLKECIEELKTFDVRPDDVWICTYPKSGQV